MRERFISKYRKSRHLDWDKSKMKDGHLELDGGITLLYTNDFYIKKPNPHKSQSFNRKKWMLNQSKQRGLRWKYGNMYSASHQWP